MTNVWSVDWERVPAELRRGRLETLEAQLAARYDAGCGLLRQEGPGHTVEVRQLAAVHEGRATAEWVALRCLLRGPTPEELPVLAALAGLQVTEVGHPRFGCSRWYGEETAVHDTNAAFFITRLLAVRWQLDPGCAATPVGALLRPYFERAAVWFAHECREPSLFYPNKIISDGCLCVALAQVLDDRELRATAEAFLDRWCTYTERRGWGFGENLSTGYAAVILDAFWLALSFLPQGALRQRLLALQDELIENLAFHAPEQLVPAIRSYNFAGETRCRGGIYGVLGLVDCEPGTAPAWLSALLLQVNGVDVQTRVAQLREQRPIGGVRRRTQRVFDDTAATSYIEGALRLGTLNRFPAIPGCNQHPTWGLGWQSMPTAFLVADQNYGFVQWETRLKDGDRRAHPSSGFLTGHATPALFAERWLPEMLTLCRQQDRVAVTVRTVFRLANQCERLADQWRVPAFRGECWVDGQAVRCPQTVAVPGWAVLLYPGGAVAIRALQPLNVGADTVTPAALRVAWDADTLLLCQTLWEGPAARLEQERVESGWITVLLPGVASGAEAEACLAAYRIEDRWEADGELPRQSWQHRRRVNVTGPDVNLEFEVDPWRLPRT